MAARDRGGKLAIEVVGDGLRERERDDELAAFIAECADQPV